MTPNIDAVIQGLMKRIEELEKEKQELEDLNNELISQVESEDQMDLYRT